MQNALDTLGHDLTQPLRLGHLVAPALESSAELPLLDPSQTLQQHLIAPVLLLDELHPAIERAGHVAMRQPLHALGRDDEVVLRLHNGPCLRHRWRRERADVQL